ncbi:hypothetical protein [Cellulomonas palmilytica]|uniref:hypothetical protein n=1 Tax=Cellulomonas palmilytica TaxID=2608402 RepID=UPI001F3D09FE|nr:hypothetical protein [Cellulomonas palmilytica]UJP39327.1 hypothetical protein F1D97_13405 [Cellulomonas palmilytica]
MSLTINRAETTVEVCTDLALKAQHEQLERALLEARRDQRTMASQAVRDLAEKVREVEHEMAAQTVVFTLRALPHKRWAEFEEAHPPSEGNDEDKSLGVNTSTFFDAVLPVSIVGLARKSDGEPIPFDAPNDWPALADEISNAQYNEFALTVLRLNRGVTGAPFSQAASLATQS